MGLGGDNKEVDTTLKGMLGAVGMKGMQGMLIYTQYMCAPRNDQLGSTTLNKQAIRHKISYLLQIRNPAKFPGCLRA